MAWDYEQLFSLSDAALYHDPVVGSPTPGWYP